MNLEEKLAARAQSKHLTLVGPGLDRSNRTYRFMLCGHEQVIANEKVRDGVVKCLTCAKSAATGVPVQPTLPMPSHETLRMLVKIVRHFRDDPRRWHGVRYAPYAAVRETALLRISFSPVWRVHVKVLKKTEGVKATASAVESAYCACLALLAWPDSLALMQESEETLTRMADTLQPPAARLILPAVRAMSGTVPQPPDPDQTSQQTNQKT